MTHSTRIILFAAAICLLGSGHATSATTDAGKTNRGNGPQASNREIERKTYDGPLFPAVKDGKYGFIDIKGNMVIPPMFTSAKYFSEGLAAVLVGGQSYIDSSTDGGQYISSEKGKWGYIDRTGEIKIPPQFSEAREFSEGLAAVAVGDERPSLEEYLKEAVPLNPDYSQEEITKIWRKEYDKRMKYGYIDTQGIFKILPRFGFLLSRFKNGVASVQLAETMRYLDGDQYVDDTTGKVMDYIEARPAIKEQNMQRWIDTSGKEIEATEALSRLKVYRIPFERKNTIKIHGRAFKVTQYGLKDDNGTIVKDAKFSGIGDFYQNHLLPTIVPVEGRAYAFTDACIASTWETIGDYAKVITQKCGVIDLDGNFIVPPDFDRIQLLSENLAAFTIGCKNWRECPLGKKGIFSIRKRKIIVNPQFDELVGLPDGLIAVKIDGQWGYIDSSGKYVIPPQFTRAGPFLDGLAHVGMLDYIDTTGAYVYRGSIGALQPKPKSAPAPSADAKNDATPASTGTGFVVSRQGHVLTNHHVVDGCMTIRTTSEGGKKQLTVVGTDPGNDLALLKLPSPFPNIARFREGRNIRPGDSVVVVGFPLHGVLASEANVTTGTVSALAGIRNDTRFLQITAPVQPGNSGGPLLDQSGQIVGIVVSKLDTLKLAKATGDISQNINFAINAGVARSFLDSQSVEYETGAPSKTLGSAEIGAAAKKFTLLVECYR